MKKSLSTLLLIASMILVPIQLNSQQDVLFNNCLEQLKSPFVASGQAYKALLTGEEVAEFHTTFFEGGLYRVVAGSQEKGNVFFSIYDKERNLLFSSEDYDGADFWDFKVEGSIECIIEARLNTEKSTSGFALLMIGFQSLQNN